MKKLTMALIAGTLATGAVAPALADSPTYRQQLENLLITTGDPTYAHLLSQYDMRSGGGQPGWDQPSGN